MRDQPPWARHRVRHRQRFGRRAPGRSAESFELAYAPANTPTISIQYTADASGVQVQTGAGVLVLTELQRAGGKRLAAAPFLAGHALAVGTVLGGAGGAG